ncbi:MAG: cbb3-type cytochrome c oxidase subunit I, partial [Salinisphaera sp.]|nr:cbb3-type cytochrome c oxidase subunit I [Salinisphaera sp.]
MSSAHEGTHDHDHHHGPATLKDGVGKWVMRWITTTNHKDLGTLYLCLSMTMLFIGGLMSLVIRAELAAPGLEFVDPGFYNEMLTLHGLIMIFGGIMPGFVGLANWMVPMMVGAPDMALPRVNNWGFWILPIAFLMLLSTLFVNGGSVAGGWTMYPPLMLQTGDALPFTIFAVHMMGISSITGAMNVIVTSLNMRTPGMSLLK